MTAAVTPAPRRVWAVAADETLRCPNGHRIADALVLDHAALRCGRKDGPNTCNALVYALAGAVPGYVVCAGVTREELVALSSRAASWIACVETLGIDLETLRAALGSRARLVKSCGIARD